MRAMDMVLTSKELTVSKKQVKSFKTTLCGKVNEKYYVNFLK